MSLRQQSLNLQDMRQLLSGEVLSKVDVPTYLPHAPADQVTVTIRNVYG